MIPDGFGVEEDPPPNKYDKMSKLDIHRFVPPPPAVENCGLGAACHICSGQLLARRLNPGQA